MVLARSSAWLGFALAFSVAAACSSGKRISSVNDELRIKNAELEQQNTALKRRAEELDLELKRAEAVPATLPDEIRANLPHLVELSISKLSHVRDDDRDGRFDTLVLYLQPSDGRGRFTQLVGTVNAQAAIMPVEKDAQTIGRATFDPNQVRDAYRSSFVGTHYTFNVPIEWFSSANDDGNETIIARVQYADGVTGRTHNAERTIQAR